jgi:hypothetical protein
MDHVASVPVLGDQILQTEVLPENDPQIFNGKLSERFLPQSMTSANEKVGKCSLSPILPNEGESSKGCPVIAYLPCRPASRLDIEH